MNSRAGEFQPARGGGYVAWERNTAARPNHYDLFARADGRKRFKVNARGTQAAGGGIYGTRLVYQQWRGRRSDLEIYNLRKRKRIEPAGVNTRHWEYWPSISGRWLLFGRRKSPKARKVILFDRKLRRSKTLAKSSSEESFVAPGQVNGHWAVWWKCTRATACNVFRLDLDTGTRIEIPNPGRFQRAPSVSREGTVFFVRSGATCGAAVKLVRYAPGAPGKTLLELPAGEDINDTYAFSRGRAKTKLLYERNKCSEPATSDIWKLAHPRLQTLELRKRGAGGGTISSAPVGIVCGSDCLEPYRVGRSVTLTAQPESSSNFTGWGGACSGVASTCTVKMTDAVSVTAFFDPASSFSLSVSRKGDGKGKVTSKPSGIRCGNDCWHSYRAGTLVTLSAAPRRGSSFLEWRGACSGGRKCHVTVDRVRSVTAVFKRRAAASTTSVPSYVWMRGAQP
ncbi:hypothetical protein BH24ACT26_BH24ACT26_11030 [soil metagenome]